MFFCIPVHADSQGDMNSINLKVQITSAGQPVANMAVYAVNYEQAYENIMKGQFSSDITGSSAWTSAQMTDNTIRIAGMIVGNRNAHTGKETQGIISELFRTNFSLLQVINGNTSGGGVIGLNAGENVVSLNSPESSQKKFTDNSGMVEGNVQAGMTAVVNSSQQLLGLYDAKNDAGLIKIDTSNGQGLSLAINGIENQKTSNQVYTVDYGQSLNYSLEISKNLFTAGQALSVTINPTSNLIIDNISLPSSKNDLTPSTISSPIQFDPNSGEGQLASTAQQIGDSYVSNSLTSYTVEVPYSDKNVTIKLTAHLAPVVYLNRDVVQPGSNSKAINMNIPVQAFDLEDNGFAITASAFPLTGQVTANSPSVNTSGINFAETNSQGDNLTIGGVYLLGKKEENKQFLYKSGTGWIEVGDLTNVNAADYTKITGGNRYVIGMKNAQEIQMNPNRFNYNYDENNKINQSLIQVIGLGNGSAYFLYQVTAPKDVTSERQQFKFSIFREYGATANGQPMTKTSIGVSQNQSYKLNSIIPDYNAGVNEYNVLSASGQQQTFSSMKSIVLPLLFVLIIISVSVVVLVKVF